MMAALSVLHVVGEAADADFVAMDILPILWHMSLGPLLNLKQFQTFMDLIKKLSRRVEDEQTKKLQELSGTNGSSTAAPNDDFLGFGGVSGTGFDQSNGGTDDDFESLVKGKATRTSTSEAFPSWDDAPAPARVTSPVGGSRSATPNAPAFSWSTPSPTQINAPSTSQLGASKPAPGFRTVTPDLGGFQAMTPTSTQFSKPLQPTAQTPAQPQTQTSSSINWSTAATATSNPWSSSSAASTPGFSAGNSMSPPPSSAFGGINSSMSNLSLGGQRPGLSQSSSFSLPPPPGKNSMGSSGSSGFSLPPPPSHTPTQSGMSAFNKPATNTGMGMMGQQSMSTMSGMNSMNTMGSRPGMNMGSMGMASGGNMNSMMNNMSMNSMSGFQQQQQQQQSQQPKSGLDKYESLI